MRDAPQRQRRKVIERLARTPLVEPARPCGSPKSREYLQIDELRCDELLAS